MLFIVGCHEEEELLPTENPLRRTVEKITVNQAQQWYLENKNISTNNLIGESEKLVTALSVTPMWNLAYEWTYMDDYPMVVVPFEDEPFLSFSEFSGAKLYIYLDAEDNYKSRIMGYLADTTYVGQHEGELSVSNYTGLLYHIDEEGRIGNVVKAEDGKYTAFGHFPEDLNLGALSGDTRGPDCPSFGQSFWQNLFEGIGDFFQGVFSAVGNFFANLPSSDLPNTGFNGYDPVGFGPSGISNNSGDTNNWDGFLIENGLSDDIFVYNIMDYHEALANVSDIIVCVSSGLEISEPEAMKLMFTHHLGTALGEKFYNGFVNTNGNPDPQSFNFNDLQRFIFAFQDNHINEASGTSVNPLLDAALACSGAYLNDLSQANSGGNTGVPGNDNTAVDQAACAHALNIAIESFNLSVNKGVRFSVLNNPEAPCTNPRAFNRFLALEMFKYELSQSGQLDWFEATEQIDFRSAVEEHLNFNRLENAFDLVNLLENEANLYLADNVHFLLENPNELDKIITFYENHHTPEATENEKNLSTAVCNAYTDIASDLGPTALELGDLADFTDPMWEIMREQLFEMVKEIVADFIPGGTLATMGPELFDNLQGGDWMDAMYTAFDIVLNEADAFFPAAKVFSTGHQLYVSGKQIRKVYKVFKVAKSLGSDFLVKIYRVMRQRLGISVSDLRKRLSSAGGIGVKFDGVGANNFLNEVITEFNGINAGFIDSPNGSGYPFFKLTEIQSANLAIYCLYYPTSSQGYHTVAFYFGPTNASNKSQLNQKIKFRFDY